MLAQLLPDNIFTLFLVFARVGAALMLLPGFGEVFVSARVRLMLALAVTVVVTPLVGDQFPASSGAPLAMFVLLGGEIAVGLLIGALARMFMAALHMAGVIIGMQVSLGNAELFDPVNAAQGSVIATFLNLLGIFLVFAADLHHLMLLAVVDSYGVFAPGAALPLADVTQIAVRVMSRAFAVAMQLAAPFIVVGILFYLGLGLLARLMPAVQVFFIAIPLQIVIGFLVMTMMLSAGMMWFLGHFENVFTGQNLLRGV
jgi:flagellar biosynthetic protein FliR